VKRTPHTPWPCPRTWSAEPGSCGVVGWPCAPIPCLSLSSALVRRHLDLQRRQGIGDEAVVQGFGEEYQQRAGEEGDLEEAWIPLDPRAFGQHSGSSALISLLLFLFV